MKLIDTIRDQEKIKLLADQNRKRIVQLLMEQPSTLTMLGDKMDRSPAWVRHHIKRLEEAGLVVLDEVVVNNNIVEKFYKATSSVIQLQSLVLPESKKPIIIFSGSHDKAIEVLKDQLAPHFNILVDTVGSLNGLINLRQGICQISGTHLMDENGDFNVSYIKHIFPDKPVKLLTLVTRTQGLILQKGNPKDIHSVEDITRRDIRFLNRNPGSGTRIWVDGALKKMNANLDQINGYYSSVKTHDEAARVVRNQVADVALGIQCAADAQGLDFIPLFEERFDLVAYEEDIQKLYPIIDHINTLAFRGVIGNMSGYNTQKSGETVHF